MLDYKKIKKPLKFRIAAIFSVIMMAASFAGDLPLSAFTAEAADLQTVEDIDDTDELFSMDESETPSMIVENDARSEVIASYEPLSEYEEVTLYEKKFRSSLKGALKKAGANSGFVPIDQSEIVNNALKQFKLEYVYTSPEPYEGDTANYMERDNNFVIKARLTINTEHSIDAGNMEFRLPGTLFSNRDGGYCRIKAVAVSKFKSIPNKIANNNQIYDPTSVSANHEDSVAPFNYYIDPETGEYVFVNYDTLHSSSNMIEISFEKVEVFDVRDETTWNIEPQTHIIYNMEEECTLNDRTDRFIHYKYTEDDTEIDLYQLMKAQSSGEKIFVYYCSPN